MKIDEPKSQKFRSLILAGGGLRVAYQAGVLMALEEEGVEFQHIDGTSGGIFNTAMLASGLLPKEIAKRWRSLKLTDFISGKKARSYLRPFKMKGFADADNIRAKVFPHLGIDIGKINSNKRFNATFNVCNFSTKSIEAISNELVTEDHLIAGVSLPIFMPAIQIGESWYTDAVWIKDANLMEGVNQGADELWLVWAIGNSPTYLQGAFHQYVHMIEMSASGGLLEEYKQIELIKKSDLNEMGNDDSLSSPKLFVFKSPIALPLDPDFFLNKINARELINMGYAQAKNYLLKMPIDGEKMDHSATANLEPNYIYCFRAVFTGVVELNSKFQLVKLAIFFRYAEFQDFKRLEPYLSLILNNGLEDIPTFNSQISNTKLEEGNLMKVQTNILIDSRHHKIEFSTLLTTPWELLLGLSFKQISFQLYDENDNLKVDVPLHQSIIDRFKSVYYSTLTTVLPRKGGIKKYISVIKNFIAYEI
ncbi:patatin-like phospholipase family protein [Aquiflexum sp.]|uniref:patatin-like phospholipase family protein n=1 Tax=Aquiflexum sp. TaxID=1872584 RepID=UPI00359404C3